MIRQVPNILSSLRILLIPLMLYLLLFNDSGLTTAFAFLLFSLASITDAFDGRIARKYNIVSRLGIFLDPLADKLLTISVFLAFWYLGDMPLWMIIVIFSRDIIITGLRTFMEARNHTMRTSNFGKWKTGIQITVLHLVLLSYVLRDFEFDKMYYSLTEYNIVWFLLLVTTLITAASGLHYLWTNASLISRIWRKQT